MPDHTTPRDKVWAAIVRLLAADEPFAVADVLAAGDLPDAQYTTALRALHATALRALHAGRDMGVLERDDRDRWSAAPGVASAMRESSRQWLRRQPL